MDSSDDDDFMSDKYLAGAREHDEQARKQKLGQQVYDSSVKKADRLKADAPFLKPGTVAQMMHDRLEEGLATAIPKENKGYQLLVKMGFKERIGKTETGIKVPLQPELKRDKRGIDYEDAKEARKQIAKELTKKYSAEMAESFASLKKHEFLVK